MDIRINELRLSFIWMEHFDTLLSDKPVSAPMAFLGKRNEYQKEFEMVRAGTSQWSAPWPPMRGNHIHRFWSYYLGLGGRASPEKISGEQAWKYLVPLRTSIKVVVKVPSPPKPEPEFIRLSAEGFYYPHGVALVVMAVLKDNLPLELMVDRAIEARGRITYMVTWLDGTTDLLKLDVLASRLLDQLRETALGNGAPQGNSPSKPFTIATVIKGLCIDNEDIGKTFQVGGISYRAMEGLCSWHDTWRYDKLHDPDKDKSVLKIRNAPLSHLLYGLDRSRAVWFPVSFVKSDEVKHSLGCYHRNLTLLSLQTESLVAIIQIAASYIDRNIDMPDFMRDLARYAAGILGKLYGGKNDTYQSWSPHKQIVDNAYAEVNKVRKFFPNMGELEQ